MEPVYELRLYHTHTNERLDIVYRHGDTYDPAALDKLEHFLRDHRTGEVHPYDPRVFDLLRDLAGSLGRPNAEINVVCGYRTAWSNAFLRSRSSAAPCTVCALARLMRAPSSCPDALSRR